MLDLRGQAQRAGPLTPLVQIGVSPVGDHHERQEVRKLSDVPDRLRVWLGPDHELPETDRLTALGHRRGPPATGRHVPAPQTRNQDREPAPPGYSPPALPAPVELQHRRALLDVSTLAGPK